MPENLAANPSLHRIAVSSSLGAPFPGCEQGPAALLARARLLLGKEVAWHETLQPAAESDPLGGLLRRLATATEGAVAAGQRCLVVGGDHSLAAGTWRGVGRALGEAPGLLWIDAHLDAHTPASSPSGNAHGMPLAALFGQGMPVMAGVPGPVLDAARTVVIGARSYEPAESLRLAAWGVRVFEMPEIRRRGLAAVFAEALRSVAAGPWGISFDVDVVDPEFAPGVSTPVAGGLLPEELRQVLRGVMHRAACVGLEVAEYNPLADPDGRTATLILDLLDAVMAPPPATLA